MQLIDILHKIILNLINKKDIIKILSYKKLNLMYNYNLFKSKVRFVNCQSCSMKNFLNSSFLLV